MDKVEEMELFLVKKGEIELVDNYDIKEIVSFLKERPRFKKWIEFKLMKKLGESIHPYNEDNFRRYGLILGAIQNR